MHNLAVTSALACPVHCVTSLPMLFTHGWYHACFKDACTCPQSIWVSEVLNLVLHAGLQQQGQDAHRGYPSCIQGYPGTSGHLQNMRLTKKVGWKGALTVHQ